MTAHTAKEIPQAELNRQSALLNALNEGYAANFEKTHGRKPRCTVITYGCQMNERDSEHIYGMLARAGFEKHENRQESEIILFNTCCVRDHAEKRVFGNIGALAKLKAARPEVIIGVCGCMMQQREAAKKLFSRFEFVDMVFGTHALYALPELLTAALEGERVFDVRESDGTIAENMPTLRTMKLSAFVTIMYGCDNFCSYCVVPYVRGRERSRKPQDIIAEIQPLLDSGCKEITLLGQNVNSYGKDLDEPVDFAALLRQVNEMKNICRVRFMTSHPKDLSPRLIDAMADCSHVCRHIHLPVQSGSNAILKAMNRRYTREDYIALVGRLRERVPEIEITSDMIVGFPGETDEDFQRTLDLTEEIGFSAMYTFMYSKRAGTPAAAMPSQVPEQVKKARLLALNALQSKKCAQGNEKYVGKTFDVLIEGCDERDGQTQIFGKTDTFKTIYLSGERELIGKNINVRVTQAKSNSLFGEAIY